MSCPSIINIQPTECIGNSLAALNSNFSNLLTATCDNSSTITPMQQQIQLLDTLLTQLSAITVPGTAKAWARFDCTEPNLPVGPRVIRSEFNVEEVIRTLNGNYIIQFKNEIPTPNYALIGTSQLTLTTPTNNATWLQPLTYRRTFAEVRITSGSGEVVHPRNVSIVVF